VEREAPDAVVLDLALPRLGGRDVQKELKSAPDTKHIPIVVVSGTDTSDLDPDDFACVLNKPIDVDALIVAVQNCLRRPRSYPT
jgi:CheY-like chemotaxis protein